MGDGMFFVLFIFLFMIHIMRLFGLESESSLADAFEYVMYGKVYRIEDEKDGKL